MVHYLFIVAFEVAGTVLARSLFGLMRGGGSFPYGERLVVDVVQSQRLI